MSLNDWTVRDGWLVAPVESDEGGQGPSIPLQELGEVLFAAGYQLRPLDMDAIEDVPLGKAATESILAELEARGFYQLVTGERLRQVEFIETFLARSQLTACSPEEVEILEAAKAIPFTPIRLIEDDREDSEDRGATVPAPVGMMALGSRGQIRALGEAVIRWRKTQEEKP